MIEATIIPPILQLPNLTKESEGTFGTASVPQRFKNQLLYHETILLQNVNDGRF